MDHLFMQFMLQASKRINKENNNYIKVEAVIIIPDIFGETSFWRELCLLYTKNEIFRV